MSLSKDFEQVGHQAKVLGSDESDEDDLLYGSGDWAKKRGGFLIEHEFDSLGRRS